MRLKCLVVTLLWAVCACGGASSPAPPEPQVVDAGQDAASARDSGAKADACTWTYSCQGKCYCIGGRLDNKACADAVECQKVCSTSCQ